MDQTQQFVVALAQVIARGGETSPSWPELDEQNVQLLWAQDAHPDWECPVLTLHSQSQNGTRTVYVRISDIHRAGHYLVLRGIEVDGYDFDHERGEWSAAMLT